MGLNSRQWPEAAMIMVLFTIAELIEAKSLDRAHKNVNTGAPDDAQLELSMERKMSRKPNDFQHWST